MSCISVVVFVVVVFFEEISRSTAISVFIAEQSNTVDRSHEYMVHGICMSVCDVLYLGIFCFPLEISVLFSSRFSLYFVAVLIKRFPANTLHYELKVCQDNLLSCLLMGDLPACHFPSAMQSAPRRDWLVSIFSFLFSCEQVSGLQQNDQTWDLGALLAAM